jgi:hypothetical protein
MVDKFWDENITITDWNNSWKCYIILIMPSSKSLIMHIAPLKM